VCCAHRRNPPATEAGSGPASRTTGGKMLIIMTRDARLHAWCADPMSHAANWGDIVGLGHGNVGDATAHLRHALRLLGPGEPLCLAGHGSDTEIGDSQATGWTWGVNDIAAILAEELGPRGYNGPILIETCAETISNFSTNVAIALGAMGALRRVWLFGYNRPVDITHTIPSPSQLPTSRELQPVQVT
jgi:hypothetical protein